MGWCLQFKDLEIEAEMTSDEVQAQSNTLLEDIGFSCKVYHVANPDIPGRVVSGQSFKGYVDVIFDSPVSFSANPSWGPSCNWSCNSVLLYSTSKEAWANKRY